MMHSQMVGAAWAVLSVLLLLQVFNKVTVSHMLGFIMMLGLKRVQWPTGREGKWGFELLPMIYWKKSFTVISYLWTQEKLVKHNNKCLHVSTTELPASVGRAVNVFGLHPKRLQVWFVKKGTDNSYIPPVSTYDS